MGRKWCTWWQVGEDGCCVCWEGPAEEQREAELEVLKKLLWQQMELTKEKNWRRKVKSG